MATVPITVSSDLFISSSVTVLRFILPQSVIRGYVVFNNSEQELINPSIGFSPGGCIYQGVGCWHGIGLFKTNTSGRITYVRFYAKYGDDIVVDMATLANNYIESGEYLVSLHISISLPNRGYVRILR